MVLAADVPDAEVSWQAYDDEPAAVLIATAVAVAALASGHVDEPDAAADVAAAAAAIAAADAGDDDASFAVDSADGHELAWYATQELPYLASESGRTRPGKVPGMDAVIGFPPPYNEPVRQYQPGGADRGAVEARLKDLAGERADLTMTIGGRPVMGSGERVAVVQPHSFRKVLGEFGNATEADVAAAIAAAGARRPAGGRCRSRTAPPSSCARPTCWRGRGGRRSTPRRSSASPSRSSRRRSTPPAS